MDTAHEVFRTEAENYVSLLEQLGVDDRDASEYRNRTHRRFSFNSPEKTILIQIGDDVGSLCDLSVDGISFFSVRFFESGDKFGLDFDGRYQVDIEVINAFPVFSEPDDGKVYYRHNARFVREIDGYNCTIAALTYFLEIEKGKF